MKNKHYKIVAIALLTIVVGSFTHCVQNSPIGGSSISGSTTRSPSGSPPPPTPEQVLNQAQVEVGLKNFEQLNYTFSELTGIPVASAANTYNAVESTLPSENAIKVLQSSHQVSITRLAAEYCRLTAATAASRDRIFYAGILNQLPAAVNKDLLIENITNSFWGEDVVDPVELDSSRLMLSDLFEDIVAMEPAGTRNSTNTTLEAVRGVCTAALSSAYVTTL